MAENIMLFNNSEFGQVRAIMKDGEPWFVARDVAVALQYKDTDQAIRQHCNYAKLFKPVEITDLDVGPRGMVFIPEFDVYALIFGSTMPKAAEFRAWVYEEVLPSIRKTGSYSIVTPKPLAASIVDKITIAKIMADMFLPDKNQQVLFVDKAYYHYSGESMLAITGTELIAPEQTHLYNATEIGKELGGLSAQKVNILLADMGLQFKVGDKWEPTEDGVALGATIVDAGKKHSNGTPIRQLKWGYRVIEALKKGE